MSDQFRGLVLNQEEKKVKWSWQDLTDADLPEGDVTVEVAYSSLNFKDALAVTGRGKIARRFPMVPGIDLAGRVLASSSPQFKAGDEVIATGYGIGEGHWGGYAERARLKSDWLLPLPKGLSLQDAMAVGTAGFTAMLCVLALEDHGLDPAAGPVLVTGASGGVGSVAVYLLKQRGCEVAAVSSRESQREYLQALGAAQVVSVDEVMTKRPLDSERWAAAVDVVGGELLASVLATMKRGASVSACGLAGSHELPTTVFPFILRGVNLLGIDSVECPQARRRQAWTHIAAELPESLLRGDMVRTFPLAEAPQRAEDLLEGRLRGRTVIEVTGG